MSENVPWGVLLFMASQLITNIVLWCAIVILYRKVKP